MPSVTKTDLERFEEKYIPEPNTGCWLWIAGGTERYGSFYFPSYPNVIGKKKMVSAHKAALYLYEGKTTPHGCEILHSCDNGFCCNPRHLSFGTHKQNMEDMSAKKRRKGNINELTEQQVNHCRNLRAQGMPVKDIAIIVGKSQSQISRVTKGCLQKWSHGFSNKNLECIDE